MNNDEMNFIKDYAEKHSHDDLEGLLCKYCIELEEKIKKLVKILKILNACDSNIESNGFYIAFLPLVFLFIYFIISISI